LSPLHYALDSDLLSAFTTTNDNLFQSTLVVLRQSVKMGNNALNVNYPGNNIDFSGGHAGVSFENLYAITAFL